MDGTTSWQGQKSGVATCSRTIQDEHPIVAVTQGVGGACLTTAGMEDQLPGTNTHQHTPTAAAAGSPQQQQAAEPSQALSAVTTDVREAAARPSQLATSAVALERNAQLQQQYTDTSGTSIQGLAPTQADAVAMQQQQQQGPEHSHPQRQPKPRPPYAETLGISSEGLAPAQAAAAAAAAVAIHQRQQQYSDTLGISTKGLAPAQAATAAAAVTSQQQQQQQQQQGPRVSPQLSELCVFLHGSIPMLQRRLPIIMKRLQHLKVKVAPLNALNSLNSSSSSSKRSRSSVPQSKAVSSDTRRVGSSSVGLEFDPEHITHIVLHALGDDGSGGGSGGSGGSSRQAAGSPSPPAAAAAAGRVSLDLLIKQAQLLLQQQQKLNANSTECNTDSNTNSTTPKMTCHCVSDGWLDAVLAAGQYVPEQQYSLDHLIRSPGQRRNGSSGSSSSGDVGTDQQQDLKRPRFMPDLDPSPDAPMGKFAMWLGRWEPSFNKITTQVEFVLQAKYSVSESSLRGSNESVRHALKELSGYEEAIGGSKGDPGTSNLNHEALTYAHAAAVVRGCSFPLSPSMSPAQLQRLLPFAGHFMARIIHQLVTTGTCEQLQCFRHDIPVANSRGDLRPNTAGGATRALFTKVPGVGPIMAEKWFKAGFRSIESLLEAAAAAAANLAAAVAPAAAGSQMSYLDRSLSSGTNSARSNQRDNIFQRDSIFPLNRDVTYSLEYRHDLFESMPDDDVTEMRHEVLETLSKVTSGITDGWIMQSVGGAARGGAVHDADWLITNNKCDAALLYGLVTRVYDKMTSSGRLVSQDQGFCRVQVGRSVGYREKARTDLLEKTDRGNRHQLDRYDHIWGIYITKSGKRRRMDLIFVPPDCHSWVFAYTGWTGSKQYLRFMRTHAGNSGMFLNSHFLMREVLLKPSAAAAAAATNAPGSRLTQQQQQQQQTPEHIPEPIHCRQQAGQLHAQQPPAAAAAAKGGTCHGCVPATAELSLAMSYVTAAAAAGSFKSVVLSVPDEVAPSDRDGNDWWPPGWNPSPAAAAAASDAAVAADCSETEGSAVDRTSLSDLVVAGVGTNRPIMREQDLFELLGLPYRPPHERCC